MFEYESTADVLATQHTLELAIQLLLPPQVLNPLGKGAFEVACYTQMGGMIHGTIRNEPDGDNSRRVHFSFRMESPFEEYGIGGSNPSLFFQSFGEATSDEEMAQGGGSSILRGMEEGFQQACRDINDAVVNNATRFTALGYVSIETTAERGVMAGDAEVLANRLRTTVKRWKEEGDDIVTTSLAPDGWLTHRFTVIDGSPGPRLRVTSRLDVPLDKAEVKSLYATNQKFEESAEVNIENLMSEITRPQPRLTAGREASTL